MLPKKLKIEKREEESKKKKKTSMNYQRKQHWLKSGYEKEKTH